MKSVGVFWVGYSLVIVYIFQFRTDMKFSKENIGHEKLGHVKCAAAVALLHAVRLKFNQSPHECPQQL